MAAADKTFKFATLQREARKRAEKNPKIPKVKPFIIDDVEPNIVISVPDTKRMLRIAECVGPSGEFQMGSALPLMRALCGDQFPRVWQLIPDDDDAAQQIILMVVEKLWGHFDDAIKEVLEAEQEPGGSEDSSI